MFQGSFLKIISFLFIGHPVVALGYVFCQHILLVTLHLILFWFSLHSQRIFLLGIAFGLTVLCFWHLRNGTSLPLPSMVSDEKSVVILIIFFQHIRCCFSLAAFEVFSLSLVFRSLIMMCLGMDPTLDFFSFLNLHVYLSWHIGEKFTFIHSSTFQSQILLLLELWGYKCSIFFFFFGLLVFPFPGPMVKQRVDFCWGVFVWGCCFFRAVGTFSSTSGGIYAAKRKIQGLWPPRFFSGH